MTSQRRCGTPPPLRALVVAADTDELAWTWQVAVFVPIRWPKPVSAEVTVGVSRRSGQSSQAEAGSCGTAGGEGRSGAEVRMPPQNAGWAQPALRIPQK